MNKMNLLVAACAAFLAVAGCNKKDQKPADNGSAAPAPAAKTADQPAAPAPAPTPAANPPAAAPSAGGGEITSAADYQTKGAELMTKITAIFTADGKNCDKLAADLDKFITDNKATFDSSAAFEKAHPEEKKAFDAKTKDQQKAFMAAAEPAMDACKTNKALADALSKVPE